MGLAFELTVAEDGDQAIDLIERIGADIPVPDIVLLDLNLPRILGPELFSRVRSHPACAHLPLIVITSSDSPKDHAWTGEYGISHYFQKPSDLDLFMQLGPVVHTLIRVSRQAEK